MRIAVAALIAVFAVLLLPCGSFAAIEPTITAESGIVYCENTGEVVFTKDPDKEMQPYSVAKLMTALVTVMSTPLDRTVTVSAEAASQTHSTAGLKEGEEVTIEELLYGALVQQGNDAAYALAEAVYGSQEKFVKKMNRTARNIGCKNTHFSNSTGFRDGGNYTTANDMLMIVKVALDNETIRTIAGTDKYLMKPTNKSGVREYESSIFKIDESVYAGENGDWEGAATTAIGCDREGLDLYIVLFGDTDEGRTSDVKALLQYSSDKIEGVLAVKADKKVGSVRVKRGAITKVEVFAEYDGYAYIPEEGSKSLITTETVLDDNVRAPLTKGDQVGSFKIKVGGELVNEVPLIVKENVEVGWPTSYLGISNDNAMILGIVLAVMAVIFMIVMIARLIHGIRKRREHKRMIMEIARKEMEEEEERQKRGWDV